MPFFSKDYPNNTDPEVAVGESGVRALRETGAPFLWHDRPGVVSQVAGEFSRVEVNKGEPYLLLELPDTRIPGVFTWAIDPKRTELDLPLKYKFDAAFPYALPFNYDNPPLYVGNGMTLECLLSDDQARVYPVLRHRLSGNTMYFGGGTERRLDKFYYNDIGMFRCAAGELGGVGVFTVNGSVAATDTVVGDFVPFLYRGDTNGAFISTAFPTSTVFGAGTTANFVGPIFAVGRGDLVCLTVVKRAPQVGDTVLPTDFVAPVLYRSTDYGLTWNAQDTSFLTPYIFKDVAGNAVSWQLVELVMHARFCALGDNTLLCVLRNAAKPGFVPTGAGIDYTGLLAYKVLRSNNDGFTWGAIGSTLEAMPHPTPTPLYYEGWTMFPMAPVVFGVGCAAFPVIPLSTQVAIYHVTLDFGYTWDAYVAPVAGFFLPPTAWVPRAAGEPGKLLLLRCDSGVVELYEVPGDFSAWNRRRGLKMPWVGVIPITIGRWAIGRAMTLVGNTTLKAYIWPGLPGAMEG